MFEEPHIKTFENVHLDKILEDSFFKKIKKFAPMHISAFEVTGIKPTYKNLKSKLKRFKDDVYVLQAKLFENNAKFDLTEYFIISRKPKDSFSNTLKKSNISSQGSYGLDYLIYLKLLDSNKEPLKNRELEEELCYDLRNTLSLFTMKAILGKRVHVSDLFENGNTIYYSPNTNSEEFNGELDFLVISDVSMEIPFIRKIYLEKSIPKKIMGDKLFFENVLNSY